MAEKEGEKFKFIVCGFCGTWINLGTTYAQTEKRAISNILYRLNLKPDGYGNYFGAGLSYRGFKGMKVWIKASLQKYQWLH